MSEKRQVWRLRKRPDGDIANGDLEFVTESMPEISDGQVLIKVQYLSLDPTNRIWMSDKEQYMPPVVINDPMRGGIAGTVVASRSEALPVGTLVTGGGEWASHIVSAPPFVGKVDLPEGMALSTVFGSLGGTGWTAYCGFLNICDPKPGETLVVSAAAGAVGSLVGQIGKIKGCRVIGIAGGAEKCRYVVEELGFDACIDYRNQDVGAELDRLCPDGIDMNFENVGGDIMNSVLFRMKLFGRMALCGLISTYNDGAPAAVPNPWELMLMRRLKVQGFIVVDYVHQFAEASEQLGKWWAEGKIKTREDIRPGLENAVTVIRDLYTGGNNGKLLIEVAP
jgi:NADPH-dependent curcumin reductase